MDNSIFLKEIKKNEYNAEDFFNNYFGIVINDDFSNASTYPNKECEHILNEKIADKVKILKKELQEQKSHTNEKISNETTIFKEKVAQIKEHTNEIILELRNTNSVRDMNDTMLSNVEIQTVYDSKDQMLGQTQTQLLEQQNSFKDVSLNEKIIENNKNAQDSTNKNSKEDSYYGLNIDLTYKKKANHNKQQDYQKENEYTNNDIKECNRKLSFIYDENKENLKFEKLLRNSLEAKYKFEKIKKGLLFLQTFLSMQKEMDENLTASKNIKLDINDKINMVLTLNKNLLYIIEHEEIISYLKKNISKDICIYSSNFFPNFFFVLNNVICSYIIDNSNIDILEILKIYVCLFKTYLKNENVDIYTNDFLINEIGKKLVQFIVDNYFTKTFIKFTQSDNDPFIHNSIINYYQYFTTFIEEKNKTMQNVIIQVILVVKNAQEKKNKKDNSIINSDNTTLLLRTNSTMSIDEKNINENEKQNDEILKKVPNITVNNIREEQNTLTNETERSKIYIDKTGGLYYDKVKKNDVKNSTEKCNAMYIEFFFTHLFKECIYVICVYIEKLNILKNVDEQKNEHKSGASKKKNFINKIMETLNTCVNILSNCTFLISKKNVLKNILNESIFINSEIMNEYIISITDINHYDMSCFETVNLQVTSFDRHDLLSKNKLFYFFIELQNNINNIITEKKQEVNNNSIFNVHFFRFVIFFSFIFIHDTEFLLLFINIYNFLYEIIYNIKQEIKKKKEENEKKKKKKIEQNVEEKKNNLQQEFINNESLQMKQEFYASNMVVDYIKNVILIFIQIVNIFDEIIKEYELFTSFIFEKTYYHFKTTNLFNSISKAHLYRQKKYPLQIDSQVAHIHNYFFYNNNFDSLEQIKGDKYTNSLDPNLYSSFSSISSVHDTNDSINPIETKKYHKDGYIKDVQRGKAEIGTNSNNDKKQITDVNNISNENNNDKSITLTNGTINTTDATAPISTVIHTENINFLKCGNYLFKSSISKLNEIKNTILNNVVYFTLIPLYDYLDKYMIKLTSIQNNEQTEAYDPQENICLIMETVFSYIEILYENKQKDVVQELFFYLSEKYFILIISIESLNKNMLRQIQVDVNYYINVCKKFKITNYKQLYLLYHSISYVISENENNNKSDNNSINNNDISNNDNSNSDLNKKRSDIDLSFQSYLNDNAKKEEMFSLNITDDDILKATTNIPKFLSCSFLK
ncbi:conserved protein, unknown function [Hepatocystis sp. ex Piliocolobus tephrosceles]|nr:conserved protein, unknown function [Hepatocystis sp. ex Piliocolobus tephrosceles]